MVEWIIGMISNSAMENPKIVLYGESFIGDLTLSKRFATEYCVECLLTILGFNRSPSFEK
jgi:hypothetical protein